MVAATRTTKVLDIFRRLEVGERVTHYCPDGGGVEMEHGVVTIFDRDGDEVVCWVCEEWSDIEAVTATLNAVSLALTEGVDYLASLLTVVPGELDR